MADSISQLLRGIMRDKYPNQMTSSYSPYQERDKRLDYLTHLLDMLGNGGGGGGRSRGGRGRGGRGGVKRRSSRRVVGGGGGGRVNPDIILDALKLLQTNKINPNKRDALFNFASTGKTAFDTFAPMLMCSSGGSCYKGDRMK
jgi:hypothetical protein